MPFQATSRRAVLMTGLSAVAFPTAATAQGAKRITVYKTPWCGCCGGWVDHLRAAGWTAEVREVEDLAPVRARFGVPERLASCHTGVVGRYAIEGHVPSTDIDRLLREAPAARALAAPGMPAGSPGMETAGREPDVTLLVLSDGSNRVFGRHNGA